MMPNVSGVPGMPSMIDRMPWRGKFTKEQAEIIDARRKRVADAMTDAWGLFGQILYIPDDILNLLAVHVAMAGDFFDDGHGSFIDYNMTDVQTPPNGEGVSVLFKDFRDWYVKRDGDK